MKYSNLAFSLCFLSASWSAGCTTHGDKQGPSGSGGVGMGGGGAPDDGSGGGAGALGSGGAPISATGGTNNAAGGMVMGGSGGSSAPALVPMFIAYGHGALSAVSCDGGQTWQGEHQFEADGHDHSAYAGHALPVFARGMILTGAGWGGGSRIMLSKTGFDWEELPATSFFDSKGNPTSPGPGVNNIDYDGNALFWYQAGSLTYHSTDARTWTLIPGAETSVGGWLIAQGDTVAIQGARGFGSAIYSRDQGKTWKNATGFTAACSADYSGIPHLRNGRVTMLVNGGVLCRSLDLGVTWTEQRVSDSESMAAGTWTGNEFILLSDQAVYDSADGASWRRNARQGEPLIALASDRDGNWVGLHRHDRQALFRSTNRGRSWAPTSLKLTSTNEFKQVAFGSVAPSQGCPTR